jgi:hypothetical protein
MPVTSGAIYHTSSRSAQSVRLRRFVPQIASLDGGLLDRVIVAALILLSGSCQSSPDLAGARARLEAVLAADRTAHLNRDVQLLASHIADTLVTVDGARVTLIPRDSVQRIFTAYFAGARYYHWQDVTPPRVALARDGSQAAVIRTVCVDREEPEPTGNRRRRVFVTTYTAIYAQRDTNWLMMSVTSTFRTPAPSSCAEAGTA